MLGALMGHPLQSNSLQPTGLHVAGNNGPKHTIYLDWLVSCWLESALGGKQTLHMFRLIIYTERTNAL